jgi:hypothetical protein
MDNPVAAFAGSDKHVRPRRVPGIFPFSMTPAVAWAGPKPHCRVEGRSKRRDRRAGERRSCVFPRSITTKLYRFLSEDEMVLSGVKGGNPAPRAGFREGRTDGYSRRVGGYEGVAGRFGGFPVISGELARRATSSWLGEPVKNLGCAGGSGCIYHVGAGRSVRPVERILRRP